MNNAARSDTRSRLLERAKAAGLAVPEDQALKLVAFYELLFRWNRTINLTSLRDSPEALDRLLLEPLAAATRLPAGGSLTDVGSGGGSPGIPLFIALSPARLVLVESRGRKTAFLREVLRTLELQGEVYQGRLEDLASSSSSTSSLVSVRAVRMSLAELTAIRQLLEPGGLVALFGTAGSGLAAAEGVFERVGQYRLLPGSSAQLEVLRS